MVHHLRYRLYTHRKEVKHFLKFALVGTLGAIIDFTVLNILVLHFGWPKATANIVSFTVAVLSNFTWNRLWTFEHARHQPLWPQLGQFALVNLIGLVSTKYASWASTPICSSRSLGLSWATTSPRPRRL